jgi:hypothetical protein
MFLSLIPSSALSPMRQEMKHAFPEVAANDTEPIDPLGPINWLLERSDKNRLLELDLDIGPFTRWVNVAYEISRVGRTFEPQGCVKNALTCVFCATPLASMGTREEYKQDRLSVWREYSGRSFEMIDVDGEHYTMLSEEHIDSFSAHMRGALSRAESDFDSPTSPSSSLTISVMEYGTRFNIGNPLAEIDPLAFSEKLKFAFENDGFWVSSSVLCSSCDVTTILIAKQ